MVLNFSKKNVVGVSVSPELGLEVAQIDVATKTVVKYTSKPLAYDNMRREIADRDLFKENLKEALDELAIPKGSEIVINIPTVSIGVADYPASLENAQINAAIEEDLLNLPFFQNEEPAISSYRLLSSTIQTTKTAYTAAQKSLLTEIAIQIKELNYSLKAINCSVDSTLNALIFNERVNISPDFTWVLLLIENNTCRIMSMNGRTYVDSFEERVSIGEVLSEDDNYGSILEAVNPILKNLPTQCLYIVSKTNVISAEKLASKLTYNAQIVHQEANKYNSVPFIDVADDIEEDIAKRISLDVIGAGIYEHAKKQGEPLFNLFNEALGDIYILEQPPVIKLGTKELVLSMPNMIKASVYVALAVILGSAITLIPIATKIKNQEAEVINLEQQISNIQAFLNKNKHISTQTFDEGDEIKIGLAHNRGIYSYFTIVGTEIPQKLWLTTLSLGKHITITGQASNLESVYGFFRNIKDYNPSSNIKLQKLNLATKSKLKALTDEEAFDTNSIITSMNADFYEFSISNAPEKPKSKKDLPELETIGK